jgi:DNA polymerase-1
MYTNAIVGYLNILQKLLDEVKPDYVACAFDVKAPTFRHARYADYKGTRKGMPEELAMQVQPLKELLDYLGFAVVEKPGYEADDLLGTFSVSCRQAGVECFLASGDRDNQQLVGDGVTLLLASTQMGRPQTIRCDEAYIRETYGSRPASSFR